MLECFESPIFKYYNIFKGDVIATFTATAPPPQKDFFQLQILKDKVIIRYSNLHKREINRINHLFEIVHFMTFPDILEKMAHNLSEW